VEDNKDRLTRLIADMAAYFPNLVGSLSFFIRHVLKKCNSVLYYGRNKVAPENILSNLFQDKLRLPFTLDLIF
jgi:hypothetical protein